ncbi:MAG: hypothetical protein EBT46_06840, partial [Actinobacteria bacterium]|nr:hypothetical protein [Actinomycetota bacterium]
IDDVESDAPDADVADVDVDVIDDDDTAGEAKTGETLPTDDERLNLDDSEEERPRRKSREDEDENELATADDQEEDLLKILEDKLRTSDDFAPEGEEPVSEADDSTDGTPLIQPRRPDEDHCQQCFLLVRKSAPKCPVDPTNEWPAPRRLPKRLLGCQSWSHNRLCNASAISASGEMRRSHSA